MIKYGGLILRNVQNGIFNLGSQINEITDKNMPFFLGLLWLAEGYSLAMLATLKHNLKGISLHKVFALTG